MAVLIVLGCGGNGAATRDAGAPDMNMPDANAHDAGDAGRDASRPPPELWTAEQARTRYCEPLIDAMCRAREGCPCALPGTGCPRRLEAIEECAVPYARGSDGIDGAVLTAVLAARIGYLDACVPGREDFSPPASRIVPVPLGGFCDRTLVPRGAGCADGHGVCALDTCVPYLALGEPCGPEVTTSCGPDAWCSTRNGRCEPSSDAGGPCLATEPFSCAPPLVCGAANTCRRLGAVGESCATALDCAPCSWCTRRVCVAHDTCGEDFSYGGCGYGGLCVLGTCEVAPRAGPAEACSEIGTWPSYDCVEGHECLGGVCVPFAAIGEACGFPSPRCVEIATCVADVCRALPAPGGAGDPCSNDCLDSLYCTPDFLCAPRLGVGEPCESDYPCASRFCIAGACTEAPGPGERCHAYRCAAGLVCDITDHCAAPLVGAPCLYSPDHEPCGVGQRCVASACTAQGVSFRSL